MSTTIGTANARPRELRLKYGFQWEDLRSPATAINPPGAASDPDRDANTGFLLFDAGGTELVYVFQQLPHAYLEGSDVSPHIHWAKSTSAAGDVAWKLEYKKVNLNAVIDSSWTNLGFGTVSPGTPDVDTANHHIITGWDNVPWADGVASDCILYKLSRVGGDASDTYAADAILFELDTHVRLDSIGSDYEFSNDR